MKGKILVVLLLVTLINFSWIVNKISLTEEIIYVIKQKKAFNIARSFTGLGGRYIGKGIPIPSSKCIMEELKGMQSTYTYKDKILVQKIFVIPVTGIDNNNRIKGFQFKVNGDDIPRYRSISQIKERIENMIDKNTVSVKRIKRGKYENYGYDEKYVVNNMKKFDTIGVLHELGDECVISSKIVTEITNGIIHNKRGKGMLPKVKVSVVPQTSMFKIARKFDKYFYNINYKEKSEVNDPLFFVRKKIYNKVIKNYIKSNLSNHDKYKLSYKKYLQRNARGIGIESNMSINMVEGLSNIVSTQWYVHRKIFQQYGGPVSLEEGWLPIEGYLNIVDELEKKKVIKFKDKKEKSEFYSYYNEKKEVNDEVINSVLAKIYFKTPWWKMDEKTRSLFAIEKLMHKY